MALTAPGNLVATPISPTRIDLTWENRGGYDFIHIERRLKDTPPWVEIDVIDGTAEWKTDNFLPPDTEYDYQIRGKIYEGEYSDYSNTATAKTFAVLAAPTLCVATAFSDFIEVVFKDNSSEEVTFRIARKVGAGAWVEDFATLPANMDYYRDEAVAVGTLYTYRVLAYRGVGDTSAPSNEDSATALSAPAAPTVLVKSGVQDKSIQLSWTDNATTETGFKIEIGIDVGFGAGVVHRTIDADITKFLVTGLTPSTQYWFRVRAYNGVGNSAYSNVVTDTTLADGVYVPTEFEKWIRDPDIEPVYLAEIYTKMDLTSFTLESGVVWKKTIGASDRGIDILEVFEDGDAYIEKTSIETVQATAETFWFDYDNRILYVHTTGGANPSGFLIEGAFWLYFSTHKNIEFTANGRLNHFLPLLAKEDIPDITQEIKKYFEGSFSISSGSIAFANAKIGGEHFFDEKFAIYTWINAKVILKAGRSDFTYAQFKEIFTAYVDEKSCSDAKITFQLRDMRKVMSEPIVLNKFWKTDQGDGLPFYPDMDKQHIGKPIPIAFGLVEGTPIPIDIGNQKWKYQYGRSKSVENVWRNEALLIENTHYYVDLQRSIITFNRDGAFVIEAGVNDKIDFDEGGGELWATLDAGTYTTAELLVEIKDKLDTAGGLTYTVTCSAAPERRFTISANGVFDLLWRTGTHGKNGTEVSVGSLIGFDDDEDDEGKTSYEADEDVITVPEADLILVSFAGIVNSADEVVRNGAEIFKYLMNNHKGLSDSELNLDSIYESKYANENVLGVPIDVESSFDEIIRSIEHSIEAYTFQDMDGKLGIRPQQTVATSKAKYIISKHIFDHLQKKDRSTLFWKVNVYYNKDHEDNWEVKTAVSDVINWKYGVTEELPIYTYFSMASHASDLATSILSLLNKEQIEDTLPMLLFDVMAGDLIKFSRTRFYDSDGTASEITLRVLRISKSPGSGKTSIVAEVV